MSNDRIYTVKLSEDELRAVLAYNLTMMLNGDMLTNCTSENSARVHDLTKRLERKQENYEKNDAPKVAEPVQKAAPAPSTTEWATSND